MRVETGKTEEGKTTEGPLTPLLLIPSRILPLPHNIVPAKPPVRTAGVIDVQALRFDQVNDDERATTLRSDTAADGLTALWKTLFYRVQHRTHFLLIHPLLPLSTTVGRNEIAVTETPAGTTTVVNVETIGLDEVDYHRRTTALGTRYRIVLFLQPLFLQVLNLFLIKWLPCSEENGHEYPPPTRR